MSGSTTFWIVFLAATNFLVVATIIYVVILWRSHKKRSRKMQLRPTAFVASSPSIAPTRLDQDSPTWTRETLSDIEVGRLMSWFPTVPQRAVLSSEHELPTRNFRADPSTVQSGGSPLGDVFAGRPVVPRAPSRIQRNVRPAQAHSRRNTMLSFSSTLVEASSTITCSETPELVRSAPRKHLVSTRPKPRPF